MEHVQFPPYGCRTSFLHVSVLYVPPPKPMLFNHFLHGDVLLVLNRPCPLLGTYMFDNTRQRTQRDFS